jgi:single-stranded-DNA-specific exonuclease
MHRPKRWNLVPPHPAAEQLAASLRTSPLIAQILLGRGVAEPEDCRRFLRPSLGDLHKPVELANLTRAAERVARAIRDGQRIVIYGDYDVDGITATAILWHAIRVLGGTADFYIPHRIDEGYGLNADAITQICDQGAGLIISVDCGITAIEQAKVACARGVDLIITDHHEWRESEVGGGVLGVGSQSAADSSNPLHPTPHSPLPRLPDCFTIVHPRLPSDGSAPYPNGALCGAGVAFKLAWGIGQAMSGAERVSEAFRAFLIDATALAALGTIADVVPLVGENRALAHFGLNGLRQSKLVGLRALIASAGLTGQSLDSFDVGYKLAPRLNACGRMGHARQAVELLTTTDEARAAEIAEWLETQNRQRQAMERKIVDEAVAQVTDLGLDRDGQCAIVLGHADWHPGVIGIVASRIVDRYHRPAVMVALSNGHGQGSGRSIAGFHLARALHACAAHLETYGGHEMAAGLRVRTEKFEAFRGAFCEYARSAITPEQLVPELRLDAVAELHQITAAVVHDLHRLGPFGHGNRRPLLCCRDLRVAAPPRRVGKSGDHLQVLVRQGNHSLKCIAFGYGPIDTHLQPGTAIDLAVEPTLNEFNGRCNVELQVKDIQFPGVQS